MIATVAGPDVTEAAVAPARSTVWLGLRSGPQLSVLPAIAAGGEIIPALVAQTVVLTAHARRRRRPIGPGDTTHLSPPAAAVAAPGVRSPFSTSRFDGSGRGAGGSEAPWARHDVTIGILARELKRVSGCIDDRRGA